ncbi:MAG: thioredoxin fold domain-containing protein [Balneolales bacterium]|nr:thioredoxin fold domain-containing protein [Balneolales bacterium]
MHSIAKLLFPLIALIAVSSIACDYSSNEKSDELFSWVSFDDAQNSAKVDGKKILVNVYTNWCEYCKKMDQTVYRDSLILASMSEHYHSVRLNADSDSLIIFNGKEISQYELAREMGIRSYPTILFLDSDGDLILQINGYMPTGDFIKMLAFIGEEAFERTDFHEFAAGNYD